MRDTASARLPGIPLRRKWLIGLLLTAMTGLTPGLALATVYKCVENNQTTYSGEPCGKHAQEVHSELSVTPPFVPPKPVAEESTGGGFLAKFGLGGTDIVTGLLFALIPISFAVMFLFSRKSRSK